MITNFFKPVTETQAPPPHCSRANVNAPKMFNSRNSHHSKSVNNTVPKRKWPFPTNNLKKNTSSMPSSSSVHPLGIRKSTWKQGNPSFAMKNSSTIRNNIPKRSFIPPSKSTSLVKGSNTPIATSSNAFSSNGSSSFVSKSSESHRKSSRNSKSTEKYVLSKNCEEEEEDIDYKMNDESDDESDNEDQSDESDSDSYDEDNELENLKDFCLSDGDDESEPDDDEDDEDDEDEEEDEEENEEEDDEEDEKEKND